MNSRAPEALTRGRTVAVDAERALALAREVLTTEANAITALSTRIGAAFVATVELILHCKGRVVVCGIGKSGHIGRKLAATLASTGTPAFFVHPTEASHGDLGMITPDDVVIMLSNSGETDELVTLTPHLKREGAKLVALTGNEHSSLAQAADLHLDAAVDTEACPLGLAPTASTTAALALGDALAIGAPRRARILHRGFRPRASGRHARPPIADPGCRHHAHGCRVADVAGHGDAGRSDRRDEPQGNGHDGDRGRRRTCRRHLHRRRPAALPRPHPRCGGGTGNGN